jgi:hypothetical protein
VQTRLTQQELATFRAAPDAVDAEALPTTDKIPTIAAKAIKVSRMW